MRHRTIVMAFLVVFGLMAFSVTMIAATATAATLEEAIVAAPQGTEKAKSIPAPPRVIWVSLVRQVPI